MFGYSAPALLFAATMSPASPEAEKITSLTNYFFWVAGGMLALVCFLTFFILIKYRAKKSDADIKQIKSNRKLEVLMIGVPIILVAIFFYLTVNTMKNVLPPAAGEPDIVITGHQWWWEVHYVKSGITTANEVHLPVGKRLLIQLRSADVIHDWWVPELGPKMDAIPGLENHLWLTIIKPGYYDGTCSEFCGQQHAWMRIRVYADDSSSYQHYLAEAARPALTAPQRLDGAHLFQHLTCGNCHRIAGTAAQGNIAPDLTHLGSRETLLTGLLPNTEANIARFLAHPQQVKPGVNMPNFVLPDSSIHQLAAYLTALK